MKKRVGVLALQGDVREHCNAIQKSGGIDSLVRRPDDLKSIDALTCAGMILLAREILDGSSDQDSLAAMDITVRRNAFGRQVDSFEKELDLQSIDAGVVTAVFIRAPWIERYGPEVEIIATVQSDSGVHPVLARQGRLLASSFHPEIVVGDRYGVHEFFINKVAS